jgi:SLT domain-containing protein
MKKISLLIGGAIGYVLGTRAGRERYEQIKNQAQAVWTNPKVQRKATQAQDFAKDKASDAAATATTAAKAKVGGQASDRNETYPTSATTSGLS